MVYQTLGRRPARRQQVLVAMQQAQKGTQQEKQQLRVAASDVGQTDASWCLWRCRRRRRACSRSYWKRCAVNWRQAHGNWRQAHGNCLNV